MSAHKFDVHLDKLLNRSVGRLLQADSFDPEAFNKLQDYLWQKAEGLQAEQSKFFGASGLPVLGSEVEPSIFQRFRLTRVRQTSSR